MTVIDAKLKALRSKKSFHLGALVDIVVIVVLLLVSSFHGRFDMATPATHRTIAAAEITLAVRQHSVLGCHKRNARGDTRTIVFSKEKLVDMLMHLRGTEDIESSRQVRRDIGDKVDLVKPDFGGGYHSVYNLRACMAMVLLDPAIRGSGWHYLEQRVAEQLEMDGIMAIPIEPIPEPPVNPVSPVSAVRAAPTPTHPTNVTNRFARGGRGGDRRGGRGGAGEARSEPSERAGRGGHRAGLEEGEVESADDSEDDEDADDADEEESLVAKLRRLLHKARRMKNYYRNKSNALQSEKKAQGLQKAQDSYTKTPRNNNAVYSKMTVAGGYKMAIKRGSGHASTAATLLHLEVAVTDQACWQWERLLSANLVCQMRSWFTRQYDKVRDFLSRPRSESTSGKLFSYEVNTVGADATNSAVALRYKAHVCMLSSLFRQRFAMEEVNEEVLEEPEGSDVTKDVADEACKEDRRDQRCEAGKDGQDLDASGTLGTLAYRRCLTDLQKVPGGDAMSGPE